MEQEEFLLRQDREYARVARITKAAEEIAQSMIEDARNSGGEPVVFVTGSSYFPPLRSFTAAEEIWQEDGPASYDMFATLCQMVDEMLNEAGVALDVPDGDNCLYVVDTRRFEFVEEEHRSETTHTYSDEWRPIDQEVK